MRIIINIMYLTTNSIYCNKGGMKVSEIYDVTIVGGGPAGLYSAFYSGLRAMKTKIIESQAQLGGKVHIYPEKMIWDVGGLRPMRGEEFVRDLIAQGLTFEPTLCLNTKVEYITKENGLFTLLADNGEKHFSKTIIMANGGGIISPQKLEVEGATKYELTNLHYTVQRIDRFKGKHVLISGGGNAAIDWAAELLHVAESVTVIYRKDELTAHEAQIKKLQENHVEIVLNATIVSLVANKENHAIDQVIVDINGDNRAISVDEVLINHGYNREASLEFEESIQPEMKDDYYYIGTPKGVISTEGIFAAGDIISYEGKVNLLVGAFQDAVNAVNSAKVYIEPSAYGTAMVSSHNEAFTERSELLLKEELGI